MTKTMLVLLDLGNIFQPVRNIQLIGKICKGMVEMYKKGIRGTLRCIDLLSLTISIALIVSLFGGECQAAQTDKFRTEPMFPGQEGYELVNFSDAPTGKFAELLQQTDLWKHNSQANPILNQNMRFFANKQFFGVINDQTAPGTLVG
jgi:hypothetical protein